MHIPPPYFFAFQTNSGISPIDKMKFLFLTAISIGIFDVSYGGLKCCGNGCLTENDMGAGWGSFFEGQENAPCLAGVVDGPDTVSCSDVIQISVKRN